MKTLSLHQPRASSGDGFDEQSWRLFHERLRLYVGRRAPAAEVDDIVGDIMVKLVRSRDSLVSASNPSAWMIRVAANTIADHYRRRAADRNKSTIAAHEYPLLTGFGECLNDTVADDTAAGDIVHCLEPFIRRLPERYAETLVLTEINALTGAEAAKRLGVSVSTIKSRVRRGRARLKQMLRRCCELQLDRRGGIIGYRRRGESCGTAC